MHRGLLGLPRTLETTRVLLCAAPAKGVATYLETDLVADIKASTDLRAMAAAHEVLSHHMQGGGRLKKDLGGSDLSVPAKKSVRSAANQAAKALEELTKVAREEERANAPAPKPRHYEMDRDVRLDDAEDEARREMGRALEQGGEQSGLRTEHAQRLCNR